MASTSSSPTTTEKSTKMTSAVLGIVYSIVINGALPFIIYSLLKSHTSLSDFWALVISGVPPMISASVDILRKGHIDIIAVVVLLGIAVSIVLILLGGSPRLLLIRESFFTAAFGLTCWVSLLLPRPLLFYFARQFTTGNVPERLAWFNSLWQYPGFRLSMRVMTAVWGVGFILEVVVRSILVFTLTIPQFLIISPFVFYGFYGALFLWTMFYSRRGRKRSEETRLHTTETPEASTSGETIAGIAADSL